MVSTSVAELSLFMKKIRLSGKKGAGRNVFVDDDNYEEMLKHSWHLSRGCAATTIKGKHVKMHRLITGFAHEFIDHINGNHLENRKANLRPCTHAENVRNSKPSGNRKYKGVFLNKKKWRAILQHNGKFHRVDGFDTARDAAIMYNYLAERFFGEFAYFNKIEGSKRWSSF